MKATPKGLEIRPSHIARDFEAILTNHCMMISQARYNDIQTHNLDTIEEMLDGVTSIIVLKTGDWRSLANVEELIEELNNE